MLHETPDRVIVFSEHLPTLALIAEHVCSARTPPDRVLRLALRPTQRAQRLAEFKREERGVFVATRAGTEGLNLQFCNVLVNYELPWNPMVVEQRIGRIHRIGQTREAHIINLAAQGTVEAHVLSLLDQKIKLFELVVGELDVILGDFGGAESLEETLTEAWLSSESDAAFEAKIDEIGTDITKSREAGLEQEQLNSELAAEDNAMRLEKEFRRLSITGRVRLGYGTNQLSLGARRGGEASAHRASRQRDNRGTRECRPAGRRRRARRVRTASAHNGSHWTHADRAAARAGRPSSHDVGRCRRRRRGATRSEADRVTTGAHASDRLSGGFMIEPAHDALSDTRIRQLLARYASLAQATLTEIGPSLLELQVPASDRPHFGRRERVLIAFSLGALDSNADAEMAVVGSPFVEQLLQAIRARGARLSLGLVPPAFSADATAVTLDIPIVNASASAPTVRVARHAAGRLLARVLFRAGAVVEEHLVESGWFDFTTGAPLSSDLVECCAALERDCRPSEAKDLASAAGASVAPLPRMTSRHQSLWTSSSSSCSPTSSRGYVRAARSARGGLGARTRRRVGANRWLLRLTTQ